MNPPKMLEKVNSKNVSVGRKVRNAIRKMQGNKGVSLPDLKKFLSKKMDTGVHGALIKLALKNGMDRGILARDGGLYKIKEAARRRRKPSSAAKSTRRSKNRKRSAKKNRVTPSRRRKSPRRKRKSAGKRSSRRRRSKKAAPMEE